MDAPVFSTFSAIAEVFVTAGVLYVVYTSYTRRRFEWRLATALIVFEFSVNMMYMIVRMRDASGGQEPSPSPYALLMAAHGILSVIVFVLFVVYCYLAFVAARHDRHLFAEHRAVTWSFVGLWLLSVGSGEVLYVLNYIA